MRIIRDISLSTSISKYDQEQAMVAYVLGGQSTTVTLPLTPGSRLDNLLDGIERVLLEHVQQQNADYLAGKIDAAGQSTLASPAEAPF
jgi:hypothetical protein